MLVVCSNSQGQGPFIDFQVIQVEDKCSWMLLVWWESVGAFFQLEETFIPWQRSNYMYMYIRTLVKALNDAPRAHLHENLLYLLK